MRWRCYRGLFLAAWVGLAGCMAQAPLPLYQLDAGNPPVPTSQSGPVVLLGPLSVADYLQRDALLQRQPDGSLSTSSDGRWAGSLQADIQQLLLRQLAWRLQTPHLLTAPVSPGVVADVQLQVSISRLDSGPQAPALLQAQWRLLDKSGQLRDSRLLQLEMAHQATLASQVQAQSVLLQQLAEQLAAAVSALHLQAPVEASKPVAPARKPAPPKPARPEPVRGPAEVYRF